MVWGQDPSLRQQNPSTPPLEEMRRPRVKCWQPRVLGALKSQGPIKKAAEVTAPKAEEGDRQEAALVDKLWASLHR